MNEITKKNYWFDEENCVIVADKMWNKCYFNLFWEVESESMSHSNNLK